MKKLKLLDILLISNNSPVSSYLMEEFLGTISYIGTLEQIHIKFLGFNIVNLSKVFNSGISKLKFLEKAEISLLS